MTALSITSLILASSCSQAAARSEDAVEKVTSAMLRASVERARSEQSSIADGTVATAVEWLKIRDNTEETDRPRRGGDYFLGFLKGRFGVSTPDWWRRQLRRGLAARHAGKWYDSQRSVRLWSGEPTGWRYSGFDQVSSVQNRLTLRCGAEKVVVNRADVVGVGAANDDWDPQQDGAVAGLIRDGLCALAMECPAASAVGGPHEVVCLSVASSKVLWRQSLDDGLEAQTPYSGAWHGSYTEIAVAGEFVTVWIGHDVSLCFHMFRKDDGRRIASFASGAVDRVARAEK